MKSLKNKTWQHEVTGVEGEVVLFNVNIFDYKWENTNEAVKVKDPLYGQEFTFDIYTVTINGQEQKFAAGEFSNCVWGFYTLKY
ncbi:MAG: hypothetical protein NC393_04600 [Clostridium sp.]|nr:hypothetical protein [Clostridium sp.]MCM1209453.1 hypothetical protein [Ruminococcus sp.]MCM1286669.1 hypothetical protein [Clostridium sp.]